MSPVVGTDIERLTSRLTPGTEAGMKRPDDSDVPICQPPRMTEKQLNPVGRVNRGAGSMLAWMNGRTSELIPRWMTGSSRRTGPCRRYRKIPSRLDSPVSLSLFHHVPPRIDIADVGEPTSVRLDGSLPLQGCDVTPVALAGGRKWMDAEDDKEKERKKKFKLEEIVSDKDQGESTEQQSRDGKCQYQRKQI